MSLPQIVSRDEWVEARRRLLDGEKVARTASGGCWTWDTGCPSCTAGADELSDGLLHHLHARQTMLVAVARAPYEKLARYRAEPRWTFPFYSSYGSDFHVTLDEPVAPLEYNYRTKAEHEAAGSGFYVSGEQPIEHPGESYFVRDGAAVFHADSVLRSRGGGDRGLVLLPRPDCAGAPGGLGGAEGAGGRPAPCDSRLRHLSGGAPSGAPQRFCYFGFPMQVEHREAAPGGDEASSAEVHRQHHNVTFTLLAVAAVAYALLQSLVAPALLTIQHDLHTTTAGAAWILTAYLLSASVMTPIAGRLGDMFGKKRTMVIILGVLAAGTALAGLASSIELMIAARVIQGAGGAVFPLAFAIIRDEFPRERIPHGIALISAIMGIGGGLGIVLAGPIVQHLSYHWLFWLPLVAVLVATAGIVAYVPESPIRTPGRVDPLGAVLLSAWLVALLVPISEGPTWGWLSGRTVGLFVLAAAVFPMWVWAESRSRAPLVDMGMMRLRPVWTTNLAALVIGFGMFASFVLVPEFVELPSSTGFGFGASVTEAGLFMVPATLGMLAVGPVSGRLSTTVGSKVPLQLGAFTSSLAFVMLAVAHGSSWEIYVAMLVMGIGIGFAFGSMANLIIESVPAHQTGVATGMNTIVRSIGGAVGSQVAAGIVTATVAASGAPTERGFTIAFAVAAGALAVGFVVAMCVPAPAAVADEGIAEAA